MFAHNVINQMNKYIQAVNRSKRPGYDAYVDKIAVAVALIKNSIKYHLGEFETTIGDKVMTLLKTQTRPIEVFKTLHEFIVTPYPVIWVDWINRFGEKSGTVIEHRTTNDSNISILNIIGFIAIENEWIFNPTQCRVILSKDGTENQMLFFPFINNNLSEPENDAVLKVYEEHLQNISKIAYMLLLFLNCKNVVTVDKPASRLMQRITKKGKQAPFTYRTIYINDTRKQYTNKRQYDGIVKGIRPLHTVPAHIARYYPERPLFGIPGNYGLFMISEHERGNPDVGTVYKNYSIKEVYKTCTNTK